MLPIAYRHSQCIEFKSYEQYCYLSNSTNLNLAECGVFTCHPVHVQGTSTFTCLTKHGYLHIIDYMYIGSRNILSISLNNIIHLIMYIIYYTKCLHSKSIVCRFNCVCTCVSFACLSYTIILNGIIDMEVFQLYSLSTFRSGY